MSRLPVLSALPLSVLSRCKLNSKSSVTFGWQMFHKLTSLFNPWDWIGYGAQAILIFFLKSGSRGGCHRLCAAT
jgi:hypothetical protein